MAGSKNYLDKLRALGWMAGVVEKFIPYTKTRVDLFGFADLVCIVPGRSGVTFLQVTSGKNGPSRVHKLLEERWDQVKRCLDAGNHVEVWDWRSYKPRGEKKFLDAVRWEIVCEFGNLRAVESCKYSELAVQRMKDGGRPLLEEKRPPIRKRRAKTTRKQREARKIVKRALRVVNR